MLSISVTYSQDSKKQLYLIGGGGEPKGERTIFDKEVEAFGHFAGQSDWQASVSFNGGHKKTEEIIKKTMPKAENVGEFSRLNYERVLNDMTNKLLTGELKNGDQLMIMINTHGAKKDKYELTHYISLSGGESRNMQTLAGAPTQTLDRLEDIAKLAAQKGVKLAIIDGSCYSGNTLSINDPNICIISASGTDHMSYGGGGQAFMARFIDRLKKGKNLEEVFLEAREDGAALPDFPMISTSAGRIINEKIYPLISNYLDKDSISDDFFQRYKLNENLEGQLCKTETNYGEVQSLLMNFEEVFKKMNLEKGKEIAMLRGYLKEYRDYQKRYEESLVDLLPIQKEIRKILETYHSSNKKIWESYNEVDFLTTDINKLLFKVDPNAFPEVVANYKKQEKIMNDVKKRLSIDSSKKLRALEKAQEQYKDRISKISSEVGKHSRVVYDVMYREISKYDSQKNPCKDFVL